MQITEPINHYFVQINKTMKYFLPILTFLFLISCGTKKNQVENEKTISVINTELKITVHVPYCGGARPTDEMLNKYKPVTKSFILASDNKYERLVKSNELGVITLALPVGKYHLKELYKNVSFDEFYAKEKESKGNFIEVGSSECYKKWWQKNVIDFEITDSTTSLTANGMLYSNCYTKNPCDKYTGPYAP